MLSLQKSDKAPETVLKLSEILDYILYQCNDKYVTIEKESNLIKNYIDLEKLRYGARLSLSFEEDIDNPDTAIAPLILVSLIENAFKHGASGSLSNPVIKISLSIKNQQLLFSIFNSRNSLQEGIKLGHSSGIGLTNTKNQLQLVYPNKHRLDINEKDQSYQVDLHACDR